MELAIIIAFIVIALVVFLNTESKDEFKSTKKTKPIQTPIAKKPTANKPVVKKSADNLIFAMIDKVGQDKYMDYVEYFKWGHHLITNTFTMDNHKAGKVTLVSVMMMPMIAQMYFNIQKYLTSDPSFRFGSISPNAVLRIPGPRSAAGIELAKEIPSNCNRDEDNYYIAMVLLGNFVGMRAKRLDDKYAYGMFHQGIDNEKHALQAIFVLRMLYIVMKMPFIYTNEILESIQSNGDGPDIINVTEMSNAASIQLNEDLDNVGK